MNENNLWLERWEKRQIGFNQNTPSEYMMKYFERLALPKGSRVLVPLCGKTIDILWLLSEGYEVVGIELSQIAIEELFNDLDKSFTLFSLGDLTKYSSGNLSVFIGDIFDVNADMLGKIDAIYDRAAIVALTPEVRKKYTAHLREISNTAAQLLVTVEYDQSLRDGTPYSVEEKEIKEHYATHYKIELLTRNKILGGFKNIATSDAIWLLH